MIQNNCSVSHVYISNEFENIRHIWSHEDCQSPQPYKILKKSGSQNVVAYKKKDKTLMRMVNTKKIYILLFCEFLPHSFHNIKQAQLRLCKLGPGTVFLIRFFLEIKFLSVALLS